MKTTSLLLIAMMWNIQARAADPKPFQAQIQELFGTATLPTQEDAKLDWACVYADDPNDPRSSLHGAEPFGFALQSGRFVVTTFAVKAPILLDEKNGALLADSKTGNYLAIRAFTTPRGRRLVLEQSDSLPQAQRDNDKSTVSGFTPSLYMLCEDRDALQSHLTGN